MPEWNYQLNSMFALNIVNFFCCLVLRILDAKFSCWTWWIFCHLKKFLLTRFVHATRVWIQIVWINDAVKVLWCCFFLHSIIWYYRELSWAELEFRLAHNQWFVICIYACLWVCTWIGIVLLHGGTLHFSTAVKFLNNFCFTNKVFVLVFFFHLQTNIEPPTIKTIMTISMKFLPTQCNG